MANEVYLTRAGFEKLSKDLEFLKTTERRRISKAIGEARLLGDISENAEYDSAKDAQAHCEARIAELENSLSNVRIIEDQNIPGDKIYIGAIVTLRDLTTKGSKDTIYQLVAPEESDFEQNKLSVFSPIGKALLAKKTDDEVEVKAPAGTLRYKVIKIERPK